MNEYEGVGYRREVAYMGKPMYINVFPNVKEIFCSSVKHSDPLIIAANTAVTRLCTVLWQKAGIDTVIDQLSRSSIHKNDLPGLILFEMLEVKDFEKGWELK